MRDQLGYPLANVPVSEYVTVDKNASSSTKYFGWIDQKFGGNTDAKGQIENRYLIWAESEHADIGEINAVFNQKLTAAGWVGKSIVTITTKEVVSTGTPVKITGTPVTLGVK